MHQKSRRFLVVAMPGEGHVNPLVPVVRTLVERGHQVVWYGSPSHERKIAATGAEFAPIKSMVDWTSEDIDRLFPDREKHKGMARIRFDFKNAFIDCIPGMEQDVREILARFPADVLLTDSTVVLGRILCEQGVLPWAALNISVLHNRSDDLAPFGMGLPPATNTLGRLKNRALHAVTDHVIFGEVHRHYRALAAKHGWPGTKFGFDLSPYLNIQPCVPEMEYPRENLSPLVHFVGALLPDPPLKSALPVWWNEMLQCGKPVVLVTQGTVANTTPHLVQPTLDALADEDVYVVATTGEKTAEEWGLRVPKNARVEPFVPYGALMPHLSATVTNGGYGGVMISLSHGVPLVVGGTTEDKTEVNARVAYTGVGVNLKADAPAPEAVREAVRTVLRDRSYRDNARRMQALLTAGDAPGTAASLLERLAETKQPVLRGAFGTAAAGAEPVEPLAA